MWAVAHQGQTAPASNQRGQEGQLCYLSSAKLSWEDVTGMDVQNLFINF